MSAQTTERWSRQPKTTVSVDARAVLANTEHFQRRVLQDALAEATASYWRRRAATFRWVGDYGNALETAQACENRATVALVEDWPEVDHVTGPPAWADPTLIGGDA